MSTPTVPARPTRSQRADVPLIPPRPKRSEDRSVSPHRDRFAASPLHEGFASHRLVKMPSNLGTAPPQRPPSVDLPSIGQEGNEYAHLQDPARSQHTTTVAGDLPLHAPKASLPAVAAKARVAAVTRTDSNQAAALGIGRPSSVDKHSNSRPQSATQESFSLGRTHSRPQSIRGDDDEHGIPEIGVQIPLYKNAGDVQAPTPSPYDGRPPSAAFGHAADGLMYPPGRRHERTKSGREVFHAPPGSYGLHGHGQAPRDQFENSWYEKHPEEREREAQGAYGPAIADHRHDWALSSEELNKLVHKNVSGAAMESYPTPLGTPDETVGYIASDEYTLRITSPQSPGASGNKDFGAPVGRQRTISGTHAESPLRKMSFPTDEYNAVVKRTSLHEQALEAEHHDETIHVEPISRTASRNQGRGAHPSSGYNTDNEEGEDRAPILASDEVAKAPWKEYLQPAVPPTEEHGEFSGPVDAEGRQLYTHGRHSRPSSRSGSTAGLTRWISHDEQGVHTPLENVKEYEPLFPEDEAAWKKKNVKAVEHHPKRPDILARHHFPSQDIWEDAPSSSMFVTTVETPEQEAERKAVGPVTSTFETPEAEAARKRLSTEDQESFLSEHTKKFAKSHFNKAVRSEMPIRPGLEQRRFPSQDIWEDSPAQSLITTVINPSAEADSPIAQQSQVSSGAVPDAVASKHETAEPISQVPVVPDRPRPQVPSRPRRMVPHEAVGESTTSSQPEGGVATRNTGVDETAPESTSETGPTSIKKGPPPKPVKNIGNIKGSFISDLQNKLQLGPQAVKKDAAPESDPAEEKAPLTDARKGRARGPQRRKPAASPGTDVTDAASTTTSAAFSLSSAASLWNLDSTGSLNVHSSCVVEAQPTAPIDGGVLLPVAAESNAQPDGYFEESSPETSTKAAAARAPESSAPLASVTGDAEPVAGEITSQTDGAQIGQTEAEQDIKGGLTEPTTTVEGDALDGATLATGEVANDEGSAGKQVTGDQAIGVGAEAVDVQHS